MTAAGALAAVDCGTNSTRLLVADRAGRTLERRMEITRLGAGVDATGRLAPDAMARTLAVLRRYRQAMDRHRVEALRVTATSAARDAANRDEFLAAVAAVTGAQPELLGGDDEARLSYAGARAELDGDAGPWLVADIGGGSTELAVGTGPLPDAVCSLDIGCVRVSERFLAHDPPLAGELEAARGHVDAVLAEGWRLHPALAEAASLAGLAGTVSALARIDLRLATYERAAVHGHRLSAAFVEETLQAMAVLPAEQRRRVPGMEAARADVIVGGLIVLSAVVRAAGVEALTVSEADILDGLIGTVAAGRGPVSSATMPRSLSPAAPDRRGRS